MLSEVGGIFPYLKSIRRFFLSSAAAFLFSATAQAQLSYPFFLMNELDNSVIGPDVRQLVILIHGWTDSDAASLDADYRYAQLDPDIYRGSYSQGYWSDLRNNLIQKLSGTGWRMVCYHWEVDASTGRIFQQGSNFGYIPATYAAQNAASHGTHLGPFLHSIAPNLREVHFIAHSAGSWVAREAMRTLLQANPYVTVQMTILDPFIPDDRPDLEPGPPTGLSQQKMNDTTLIGGLDRIYRLENYFSVDASCDLALSTDDSFVWRNGIDIGNGRVDWGGGALCRLYYPSHSNPIQFYSDCVQVANTGAVADGLNVTRGCPFDYHYFAWNLSPFAQQYIRPVIVSPPQDISVSVGGNATLSVSAYLATAYEWFKVGWPDPVGSGASLHLNNVSLSDAGDYVVRVSNDNGLLFSDKSTLTVYPGPPPTPTPGGVVPPTVQTLQPTNVTSTSATLQGKINYTGGATIVEARFEWTGSTFPGIVIYNVPISGSNFSYTVTGLQPNAQYTYHAYAKNAAGLWNTNPNNISFYTAVASTLANIAPYQPSGWSDKVVVSRNTGTTTDSAGLLPTDNLYAHWALVNNGGAATSSLFYSQLFVDNVLRGTWYTTAPLGTGFAQTVRDFPIGSLGAGTHFITLKTDTTSLIPESNESDNDYTKTVVVGAPTPPPAPSPSATPPGYLVVNPTNFSVGSGFGANVFEVRNTGAGGLLASVTSDSWITVGTTDLAVSPGEYSPIHFTYLLNTSTIPRTGTITVNAPGAINSPQRIYVVQDAQNPTPAPPPPSPTPTPTPPQPTPTPNPISDASPDFLWVTNPGFTGNGIATDAFGNSYTVGIITGPTTIGGQTVTPIGGTDVVVVKYDAAGNFVWVRQAGGRSANWSGSDWGNGVAVDSNGNVYITGHYTWTVTFGNFSLTTGAGTTGLFVAKYDSAGNVLWLSGAVGASTNGFVNGQAIAVDSSGSAYTTGQFTGSVAFGATVITAGDSQADIVIAKYDSSGSLLWVRQAGGLSYDQPWAITTDSASNCYFTGYSGSQSLTFGGIVVNRVPGSPAGSTMMFAAKYDQNGTAVWATQASSNSTQGVWDSTPHVAGAGIAVDGSGNIFVTGVFGANMVFGAQTTIGLGAEDLYLCKINTAGNPVSVWETGTSETDPDGFHYHCNSRGLAMDRNGNCYITGYFQGTVPFGSTNLTSSGGQEVFVARLNGQSVPAWAVQAGSSGNDIAIGIQVDASGNAFVEGSIGGVATFGNLQVNGSAFLTEIGVPRYTISLSVNPIDGGITSGAGVYVRNSTVTTVAIPNVGYLFQGWFENGSLVWPDETYEFIATSTRSLLASFVSQAGPTPPPTATLTFATWLQGYFTPDQLNDPAISGDGADPDHDGLSNLMEYALGSDPTKSSEANRPYGVQDSTYFSLIYTKVLGATDLTYGIEESTNVQNWTLATPINVVLFDDGIRQTLKAEVPRADAGPGGKLFLRLKVSH